MKKQPIPNGLADWQQALRGSMLKFGVHLHLSQAMLEFLCAVADDVKWDRALDRGNIHRPDNWLASEVALTRRGLIKRKPPRVLQKHSDNRFSEPEWACCELTPAGKCVVELVKMSGVFVEAVESVVKQMRKMA
jgi:hypothetical protein